MKSTTDSPMKLLSALERQAESNEIPAGQGRAAWILSQWEEKTSGERVWFGQGTYTCAECGESFEKMDHGPVRVAIPAKHDHPQAAVMGGPYCPACGIDKSRGNVSVL